ncbi:MAG: SIS domain-containing protein [Chloroflexota bacterium]
MDTDRLIIDSVGQYSAQVIRLLERLPVEDLWRAIKRLEEARWKGQSIFTCGNGGSAATAIHFASDLAKSTVAPDKPAFRALSLCENISLVTAWANDAAYDYVFAERLNPWVKPGDVLVAISGSGNSRNVLKAVEVAVAAQATTIALTGFQGGKLKQMVDICLTVPSDFMQQIEDVHLLLCHVITICLRQLPLDGNGVERALGQPLLLSRTPPLVGASTALAGPVPGREADSNGEEEKQ